MLARPIQFAVTCFVLLCHLFFFAHLLIAPKKPSRNREERRIVVKMNTNQAPAAKTAVTQHPAMNKTVAAAAPKASSKTASKPVLKPVAKPVSKQASKSLSKSVKKPESKPQKKQEKEGPAIPAELLSQLQESIAKIEKKPDKYRASQSIALPEKPMPIASSSFNTANAIEHRDYLTGIKEELIRELHQALHLPDYGEVKVQIELSERGEVIHMKVLKSASQKNREYLKKELPRMFFSYLNVYKLSAKERIFTISFCNEL